MTRATTGAHAGSDHRARFQPHGMARARRDFSATAAPERPAGQPRGCLCCGPALRMLTAATGRKLALADLSAATDRAAAAAGPPGDQPSDRTATAEAGAGILFTNASVLDGLRPAPQHAMSVLVLGNRIAAVGPGLIAAPDGVTVIDCAGRTLMPGLIDGHWHTMFAAMSMMALQTADAGDIHFAAARQAHRTLMRGFTTVRDMGGPCFALKRAIDSGQFPGPRIFPSGAMISQTAGHGDFRMLWELAARTGQPGRGDSLGASAVVDGRSAVLRATREQLMQGASQIKIMAGGGTASAHDPIDVAQFLPEEIEAAVQAAADWGTYVAAHVYTPIGIRRCLAAGVRSIEHGQLADDRTVEMIAGSGAAWCLQPFVPELSTPGTAGPKMQAVWQGTDRAYRLAIAHGIQPGWGSDILFDARAAERQGASLACLARWFTPGQAIIHATAGNALMLDMSGARSPYAGRLGVIAPDALADLLVVDGDPSQDLDLIADPDTHMRLIMKDGRLYKDQMSDQRRRG